MVILAKNVCVLGEATLLSDDGKQVVKGKTHCFHAMSLILVGKPLHLSYFKGKQSKPEGEASPPRLLTHCTPTSGHGQSCFTRVMSGQGGFHYSINDPLAAVDVRFGGILPGITETH